MKKWFISLLLIILLIFSLYIEAYEMLFYLFLIIFPFIVMYFITCLFGKNRSKKNIILCIGFLLLVFIIWMLFEGKIEMVFSILIMFSPILNIIIFLGITLSFYFIGRNIGGNKARREINRELKKLKLDNPYIYFRDIPNKYGIGVSTRILNLKFSKKEVLAAILDLCAKGYIIFKQNGKLYEVIDCNKNTDTLLKNELYLLNWVKNKKNNNFSIKEWKNLCIEDVMNLGLCVSNLNKDYKPLFNMDSAYAKNLLFVSFVFSFLLVLIYNSTLYDSILLGILPSLFMAIFLTFPVFLIVFFIMLFVALFYEGKIISYNKEKKFILSELGKKEYYELCALGKFLDDFGNFTDSHIEEVVIWEQYLSYAILFRLSNKILKTGYEKLSINDNFIIEDLDKIVL